MNVMYALEVPAKTKNKTKHQVILMTKTGHFYNFYDQKMKNQRTPWSQTAKAIYQPIVAAINLLYCRGSKHKHMGPKK